jgi:integrase
VFYQPGSPNAFIEYWVRGRRRRESCGSPLESVAWRLLRRRVSEAEHTGKVVGPEIEATTWLDCEKLLLEHFDRHGKYVEPQARKTVECRLVHLRGHFGRLRAIEIVYGKVEEYVAKRLRQGAAKGTTRTEVALLHLALVRAVAEQKLVTVPLFPRVEGSPPRKGAATPEQITRLIEHLPDYLRPLVRVQYATGWRSGHLRGLTWDENVRPGPVLYLPAVAGNKKRWRDVDFDASETPWLQDLLEGQRRRVAALTLALGKKRIPWLFPNAEGEQITANAYRLAWERAPRRAGMPELRSHDCRRSATQNNRRLGLDKTVRMAMVGHVSEVVHDAYDEAAAGERKAAAKAIGDYLAATVGKMGPA